MNWHQKHDFLYMYQNYEFETLDSLIDWCLCCLFICLLILNHFKRIWLFIYVEYGQSSIYRFRVYASWTYIRSFNILGRYRIPLVPGSNSGDGALSPVFIFEWRKWDFYIFPIDWCENQKVDKTYCCDLASETWFLTMYQNYEFETLIH